MVIASRFIGWLWNKMMIRPVGTECNLITFETALQNTYFDNFAIDILHRTQYISNTIQKLPH